MRPPPTFWRALVMEIESSVEALSETLKTLFAVLLLLFSLALLVVGCPK